MSDDLVSLYQYAEENGIDVTWFDMEAAQSLSVVLPDGSCAIAIDPWKMDTVAKETVSLAHELGHCITGSFYNRYAACDVRAQHETRADKWAIKKLIPEDKLNMAVSSGYKELWELAEYFNVTEDLMRKAVHWYQYGNLAL